jgi:chromosome segregation protein
MRLKSIELSGFKSFAKKTQLEFASSITSIVGPNGSGKSNVAEAFRFVLGEQSMKSMRGRRGEDLIWNGSGSSPRAGRGSVKLIFDNSDRALNLDFDEVVIERIVHRDGANDYSLNGSNVRLRDINGLLSQANIGASGHHIISQGEADRVLTASSRERREMIEDALGLTAYLYKREEAGRKLEKTAENMHEVEALRRELMPHLKFLAAQVKKIEETEVLRANLREKYAEYLKRESVYLHVNEQELAGEIDPPLHEQRALDTRIEHLRRALGGKGARDSGTRELMELEAAGRAARSQREAVTRELGRIEGEVSAHERMSHATKSSVPVAEAQEFAERVLSELQDTLKLSSIEVVKGKVNALIVLATEFMRRVVHADLTREVQNLEQLTRKKASHEKDLQALEREEERVAHQVEALRRSIESEKDANRDAERELFQAMAKRSDLEAKLVALKAREAMLVRERESFSMEFTEAGVLLGQAIADYESYRVHDVQGDEVSSTDMAGEERSAQEGRRKKLERMKIRLEEIGAGNTQEILKEHKETYARDEFLARELLDLGSSIEKLRELIEELTQTLQTRFGSGVDKINAEFDSFFKLMFGGGSASLSMVKEKKLRRATLRDEEEDAAQRALPGEDEDDIEIEEGIDIIINLPHKRIKGLHMLSGGERALTSIALIFAMSQVNPPPFLILDETDAALDEANSKRYGDMIENLARTSQLILITHNRETMSHAGVLYGITMGNDGVSKLLSVKFEEALAVAK